MGKIQTIGVWRHRRTRISQGLAGMVFSQRHRFLLWMPVWLACGIGAFFAAGTEPTFWIFVAVSGGCAALFALRRWLPDTGKILVFIPILAAIGFLAAGFRTHHVSAPKLTWRYYGPVEGTLAHLDRSASNKPRLTLINPVLQKISPEKTPARVRVSLHSDTLGTALVPGARIMVTAHLSPPAGPVEPNGFDFQRKAWFSRLGATGYARAPPVLARPAETNSFGLRVFALRMAVSDHIRAKIGGQKGAFASAIITGDRSAIDPALMSHLRRSNLAHLLAISGLHMGLLTGFIFAITRTGLAMVPYTSLRLPSKKIGAVVALLAGASYLVLSGANIATQRAFVMVAVMLIAVIFDRPALTLRGVALAAILILLLRPESLSSPGFQMSFAATTALVATFEQLNKSSWWYVLRQGRGRHLAWFFALVVSSGVAGLATAPFSAFHFNQIAQYGLIANLLSVPVMGLLVMPSAVLAAILEPFGLSAVPFWVMGQGINWILGVAAMISGWEGAALRIPAGSDLALGLLAFGALIVIVWAGRLRWIGLPVASLGILFWAQHDRPSILISDTGRLVGIETPLGRALNREKGSGFAARSWLENDGDAAAQPLAARRIKFQKDTWEVAVDDVILGYLWGKSITEAQITRSCATAKIVIAPGVDAAARDECEVLDKAALKRGGAMAIHVSNGGFEIRSARHAAGRRLWNTAPRFRKRGDTRARIARRN